MFGTSIEALIEDNIVKMNIFRHFKGGYYVVHNLATLESSGEELVVYQSLADGKVWLRNSKEFFSDEAPIENNPTGQKMRFEKVSKFNNQLNLIPTDKLVEELKSREDNPLDFSECENSILWKTRFLVGMYIEVPLVGGEILEDFDVRVTYDTLEEAQKYLKNFSTSTNLRILKEIFVKQDFDLKD